MALGIYRKENGKQLSQRTTRSNKTDITRSYCNMDFIFASALKLYGSIELCTVSYDIACQWFVNLLKRERDKWPEELKVASGIAMQPTILAFHYEAHGQKKHHKYDLRLVLGNGISENEGPERIWGQHNALGNSTKTMGPESRHLVLDDNFGFWNWLKYSGHG